MGGAARQRSRLILTALALLTMAAWHGQAVELLHQGPVRRVLFSPDGTTLGTASYDLTESSYHGSQGYAEISFA